MRIATALAITLWASVCSGPLHAQWAEQRSEGERNVYHVLKYLLPVLRPTGDIARIYYEGQCTADQRSRSPLLSSLPALRLRKPPDSTTGLAAVREIFWDEKSVVVSEARPGVISIRIGNIPDAILSTKLSYVPLTPRDQYYDWWTVFALTNAPDMQAAMQASGFNSSRIIISMGGSDPWGSYLYMPHILPASMSNITLDQALDVVGRTFGSVVIYGACKEQRLFDIQSAGGIYFDTSILDSAQYD